MKTITPPITAVHPALSAIHSANSAPLHQRAFFDQCSIGSEADPNPEIIADQMTTEDADGTDHTHQVASETTAKESRARASTTDRVRRRQGNSPGGYANPYARSFNYASRWSPCFPYSLDSPSAEEEALHGDIRELWSSTQFRAEQIRRMKERSDFRIKLAERLHRYKALLVGSGRSGKWSGFLRDIDMPRATADRYVQRWEQSLESAKENCLSESISPPTADDIAKMVGEVEAETPACAEND
jgi:hypothetical protein